MSVIWTWLCACTKDFEKQHENLLKLLEKYTKVIDKHIKPSGDVMAPQSTPVGSLIPLGIVEFCTLSLHYFLFIFKHYSKNQVTLLLFIDWRLLSCWLFRSSHNIKILCIPNPLKLKPANKNTSCRGSGFPITLVSLNNKGNICLPTCKNKKYSQSICDLS